MNTRPKFKVEPAGGLDDRAGACDRSPRPVEAAEEPIAGRINLDPAIAVYITPDDAMVLFQHFAPTPVSDDAACSV